MAHRFTSKRDDWNIDELPVEDHQAVVGEGEEGGVLQVPHRGEDQGPGGHASTDCQSRVVA